MSVKLKKILRRIPLAVVLLALLAGLHQSDAGIVFPEAPVATGRWIVSSYYNNYIGSVIHATLRIETVPGVRVDWSKMPNVGEIVKPAPKTKPVERTSDSSSDSSPTSPFGYKDWYFDSPSYYLLPEGEMEVRSREIVQYYADGKLVTEIRYEFQYLVAIDFSHGFDDKFLSPVFSVFQSFYQIGKKGPERRIGSITLEGAQFYLVKRVDENSKPIFELSTVAPPRTPWFYLRFVGFALIGVAFLIPVWSAVAFVRRRRMKRCAVADELVIPSQPLLVDFYIRWGQSGDYQVFVEAVKLYRKGIWGKPTPLNWTKTTFVLYSGVVLKEGPVAQIFAGLIEETKNEHSS